MISRLILALGISTLFAVNSVHAHSVWIEPADEKLVIRFAEPDGKLEKSPGYLDSLTLPTVFNLVTNAPVALEALKKADHFSLGGASWTNVVCAETAFTVRAGRKPNFYARWQPAGAGASRPLLTLDIVPTGKMGEARAYFHAIPLAGVKATLRTPDEKEFEITSDSEGILRFSSNQRGQYLLTIAHHREVVAGFHWGQPYEQTSHNASLAWCQP